VSKLSKTRTNVRSRKRGRRRERQIERRSKTARLTSLKLQKWKVCGRSVETSTHSVASYTCICTYVVPSLNLQTDESASSYNDLLARLFVHASDVHVLVSHRVGQHETVLRRHISSCIYVAVTAWQNFYLLCSFHIRKASRNLHYENIMTF